MTQTKVQLLDLNGLEAVLDADADTTITADTDDQIDIKIAGADDFQFTANTFTAQSGSTITTPTLGVGNTKDLGVGLHIKSADSGLSSIAAGGDELVIEGSGDSGMHILSGASNDGNIFFGDSGDADTGYITYDHSTNHLHIGHGGLTKSNAALLFHGSDLSLATNGELDGDASRGGICLNQGGSDTQIFTLKSSDVGHGMTSFYETDTYFSLSKIQTTGGCALNSAGSAEYGVMFQNLFNTANTATSTTSIAPFTVRNYKKANSGTGYDGVLTNDQNIMTVANQSSVKFLVKADGDIYYDGADQGAYDSYDDAMLVRSWDLSHKKNVIDSKFDEFVKYNHEDLANAELVGREEDGTPNHFISLTGMQRLHNGAIWQQYEKHQRLANAMYELAKAAVGEDKANEILEKNEIKLLN